MSLDFKKVLLLIYFKSAEDRYSFSEIMNIFKMNYGQVVKEVDYLVEHKYLEQDESFVYRLTSKGMEVLKESGIENVDIIDVLDEASDEDVSHPIRNFEKNVVYIPNDFDKKFKGY